MADLFDDNILDHITQTVNTDSKYSKIHPASDSISSYTGTYAMLLVVVLLLIAYIVYQANWGSGTISEVLKKEGWTLYLLRGCSACDAQMKILGNYSDIVVCPGSDACLGISAFPHWSNSKTGAVRVGVQSPEELEAMLQKNQ